MRFWISWSKLQCALKGNFKHTHVYRFKFFNASQTASASILGTAVETMQEVSSAQAGTVHWDPTAPSFQVTESQD